MSWETIPTQSGEVQAEGAAETPEALEARKQNWGRLRSFALAASLLLNGGFFADRAMENVTLDKLDGDLKPEEGVHFVIKGADAGDFRISDGGDGSSELRGTVMHEGQQVKVVYRLPSLEAIRQDIDILRTKDPMEVLRGMIEVATSGTVAVRDPDTGITYENSFAEAPGRAGMTSRQVTYDQAGKMVGSSEIDIPMTAAPDNQGDSQSDRGDHHPPPIPRAGWIPAD